MGSAAHAARMQSMHACEDCESLMPLCTYRPGPACALWNVDYVLGVDSEQTLTMLGRFVANIKFHYPMQGRSHAPGHPMR